MSHPRYVAVLAHYQPVGCHAGTSLPQNVADLLVRRMIAERISQSLIRMFPPDSIFPVEKFCAERRRYIPAKLPPREVGGTYFEEPKSALESTSTVPRLRRLPRFREVWA